MRLFATIAVSLSFFYLTCRTAQTKNEDILKPVRPNEKLKVFAEHFWNEKCASCHGTNGIPNSDLTPAPRKFGTFGMSMGFFFGGDKMRAGIFRTIRDGKNNTMPSFAKELSYEEIWALVDKIERLPN